MGTLAVQEVTTAAAGQALARAGVVDPRGVNTPEAIAAGGQCLRLVTDHGECVMVVRVDAGTFWVDGAASDESKGLAPLLGQLAIEAAKRAGCRRVAFETARPGLVRLARRRGWKFAAFVMEHEVPQ